MNRFFGLFACLFVTGVVLTAWVVFTPGSQGLVMSLLAALLITVGAQGIRDGWK